MCVSSSFVGSVWRGDLCGSTLTACTIQGVLLSCRASCRLSCACRVLCFQYLWLHPLLFRGSPAVYCCLLLCLLVSSPSLSGQRVMCKLHVQLCLRVSLHVSVVQARHVSVRCELTVRVGVLCRWIHSRCGGACVGYCEGVSSAHRLSAWCVMWGVVSVQPQPVSGINLGVVVWEAAIVQPRPECCGVQGGAASATGACRHAESSSCLLRPQHNMASLCACMLCCGWRAQCREEGAVWLCPGWEVTSFWQGNGVLSPYALLLGSRVAACNNNRWLLRSSQVLVS